MRIRIAFAVAIGVLVGVLGTLGSTLLAQQPLSKVPAVTSPRGFIVEEVRVGQSCVVIVSRGGATGPTDYFSSEPCTR